MRDSSPIDFCSPRRAVHLLVLLVVVLRAGQSSHSADPGPFWKSTGVLPAAEAHQAAAADEKYVYAITNTLVARYDRTSGERLAASSGDAPVKHLYSGFVWDGRLFCAHSNYPQTPEQSEIKVL